jgi:hypothetical protein
MSYRTCRTSEGHNGFLPVSFQRATCHLNTVVRRTFSQERRINLRILLRER